MSKLEAHRSFFDVLAELPAETYADHMVLSHGATGIGEYNLNVEIEYMSQFARDAFVEFGGTATSRVLEFSADALYNYCNDWENQDRYGVYGSAKDVYRLTKWFLSGRATDEQCESLTTLFR